MNMLIFQVAKALSVQFIHKNFKYFKLFLDYIFDILKAQENPRPTATQSFCWPVLLSGRDLISVSNTGYGKHLSVNL